jgi:hypothetical protein
MKLIFYLLIFVILTYCLITTYKVKEKFVTNNVPAKPIITTAVYNNNSLTIVWTQPPYDDPSVVEPIKGYIILIKKKDSRLLEDISVESRFYFVHSYHLKCNDQNDSLLETNYGYNFVSAIEKKNIVGVQFHPEKSHKFGMKILNNFIQNY